jgi:hypothetical protein
MKHKLFVAMSGRRGEHGRMILLFPLAGRKVYLASVCEG